ncbi:MAG: PstS family phosphate ABC transporter substrate-binding protein [Alphaproteobacteria bacterium]|nr:PstS family phosphate ABC transporter substrate-binding protein [Alphaproteobacteria bacterium]
MNKGLLGAASVAGLSAAILVGFTMTASAAETKIITIDGSSTVFPISEAVAEEYQAANPNVRVTVGISGTGGGFKKFCRGEIDISDASRPITGSEMTACKAAGVDYVELAVAFDALTVVINPANTFAETLTVAQLKTMWEPAAEGKVTMWNQIDPSFPAEPLKLFGPGTDSGTFDYFTEAVNGKSKASRADYTASEDDNTLVQGVAQEKGGIGYFGLAYYAANADKLKAVKIDGGKGGVSPSKETVIDGTYNPLSRPIFIYVNAASLDKPEVRGYVDFYLDNAAKLSEEVGYIRLPAEAYSAGKEHVANKRVGTVFGGKNEVGV